MMGFDDKTFMWWERDSDCHMSARTQRSFTSSGAGHGPHPPALPRRFSPSDLGEILSIERAAHEVGVDEHAWRRWERKEWKPVSV